MIDPRFQEISDLLEAAINAQVSGDEQALLEHNYRIREIAWGINSDILAGRWTRRLRRATPQPSTGHPAPRKATVDDLLI